MGFFSKLFGKKDDADAPQTAPEPASMPEAAAVPEAAPAADDHGHDHEGHDHAH